MCHSYREHTENITRIYREHYEKISRGLAGDNPYITNTLPMYCLIHKCSNSHPAPTIEVDAPEFWMLNPVFFPILAAQTIFPSS